jgi:ribosome-associated protein
VSEENKSKSQQKRDAHAFQDLGVKLVALNLKQLQTLPLSAKLYQAICEAKALKSHGAVRRQAMWIGKLMRAEGGSEILAAYDALQNQNSSKTAAFHDVETWRTRLIKGGKDALTAFVEQYPMVDIQQLRQHIKKSIEEIEEEKHTGAGRTLFRYLRSFIQ